MYLRVRLSRLAGAFVLVTAGPAIAQMVQPIPGVTAPDPANTLSGYLRTLAANPRNLFALLGAGAAALDAGDPNAALGFFARAGEIDTRSGKAKAGLASALVMLEKPDDALRLFDEAMALGIPEADVVRDRGLAYDLRGDARRAQRDYAAALRRGSDDEVVRRYALSLGISGDRGQALTMLDPLLRKQDQAAWRARAFILAMNDDVSGANSVARQVMPASLAVTMAPFLTRLAKLNSAERAHAVNFGTMPADGQTFASVQTSDPLRTAGPLASMANAGDGLIPSGAPLGRQLATAAPITNRPPVLLGQTAVVSPALVNPAPGFSAAPSLRIGTRIGARISDVDPQKLPPELRGERLPTSRALAATNLTALPPAPVIEADASIATVAPTSDGSSRAVPTTLSPVFEVLASPMPAPLPTPSIVKPDARVTMPVAPAGEAPAIARVSRLASILSGIEPEPETLAAALPTAVELRASQRAVARKAAAAVQAADAARLAKDEKLKLAAAAKANPARLWVQVATGSNARGLSATWRKIRQSNEKLLKPYGGYSVSYKATNRILAGPVRSAADARALVASLAKAGVSATTYSSEGGQDVVKLATK